MVFFLGRTFNMQNKKVLILYSIIVTLLILIFSLCPIPIRIKTHMEGMHINEQKEFVKDISVNVSGWRYDYLFLQDKVKLTFDTGEPLGTLDNTRTNEYKINGSTRSASLFFYSSNLNSFSSGTAAYDKNFSFCLIELEAEALNADSQGSVYYVLSSDPGADLWNLFKEYLNH